MIEHVSDERLQEWADGSLSAEGRAEVDAHLAECTPCASEAEALRALLGDLRALPSGITPGRDLHLDIALRIDTQAPNPVHVVLRRAAVIALVAGGATWAAVASRGSDEATADGVLGRMQAEYARATVELETALETRRDELEPDAALILEQSLARLDAALEEAGDALAKDPDSALLHELVLVGYEHKLDVLRRVTDRTTP